MFILSRTAVGRIDNDGLVPAPFLPLVDVPTRARAKGVLSAMSKAEELLEWKLARRGETVAGLKYV